MNAYRPRIFLLLMPLLIGFGACEVQKSANPLSPAIAGPIPWVNITAPKPLEPSAGTRIAVDRQPVTLVIENSASNGPRPLSYVFEVATDAGFTNKVFSREGIAPGDGRTTYRLPDPLATERTYYWRSRARDGANDSPYSAPTNFNVFTPIVIDQPQLLSPANNEIVSTLQPTFRWTNAPRSGPVGPISYRIQVAANGSFAPTMADWVVAEQPGQTSTQLPTPGTGGQYLFWRVRASDPTTVGPWSAIRALSLSNSSTPGKPCGPPYPNNGPAVVACVSSQYPDKLAAVASLAERQANMAFLRDRVIETGICGGMDLGWNDKGGGNLSIDGLAWRTGGVPYWVDIGQAYDAYWTPLALVWNQGGQTGGYVTYSPAPTCN